MAFIAATSDSDRLRLAGLAALQVIGQLLCQSVSVQASPFSKCDLFFGEDIFQKQMSLNLQFIHKLSGIRISTAL